MDLVTNLPNDIKLKIMDHMWGTLPDYQRKFSSILSLLPEHILINLKATPYCKYKNKMWNDIGDNLYCPKCGEKSLFFAYACCGLLCDFCDNR